MSRKDKNITNALVEDYKEYDRSFNNSELSNTFISLLPKYFYDQKEDAELKSEVELLKILSAVSNKVGFNNKSSNISAFGEYSIYKSYWNFENNEFINNRFTTKLQFYIIATLLSIHEFRKNIEGKEKIKIFILTAQRPSELYPIIGEAENSMLYSYTNEFDSLTSGIEPFEIHRFFLVRGNDSNELLKGLLPSREDVMYEYCDSKETRKENRCKECMNRTDCVNKRKEFLTKNSNTHNYFFSITKTPPDEFFTELIAFGIEKDKKTTWKRAFISDLNRLTTSLSIQIMNNGEINSKLTNILGCNNKSIVDIINYYQKSISKNIDLKEKWESINSNLNV